MAFRCEFCQQTQLSGTKPIMIITKKRLLGEPGARMINNTTAEYVPAPWQIVEEKKACPSCAAEKREPEVVRG